MKKPKSDELIQFRCQKWMKDYVDRQGNMTNGAAAWLRDLILERYNEDMRKNPRQFQDDAQKVAENKAIYGKEGI